MSTWGRVFLMSLFLHREPIFLFFFTSFFLFFFFCPTPLSRSVPNRNLWKIWTSNCLAIQTASRRLSPFSVRCIHYARGTSALGRSEKGPSCIVTILGHSCYPTFYFILDFYYYYFIYIYNNNSIVLLSLWDRLSLSTYK